LSGIPSTLAYKDSDNQFTGQGIRAALAGSAAAVYIPWVSGDTLPTLEVGSQVAGNNQTAISARGDTQTTINVASNTGHGVAAATNAPGVAFIGTMNTALTNSTATAMQLRHNSSGTPAAGFGVQYRLMLKSSTTASQDAGLITALWTDPTHVTRKARLTLSAFDSANVREGIRIEADGTAARVGLYGVTAVARQTAAAAATDLATAIALVNDLRSKLIALGALA
jgi:hypothetical protein